MNSRLRTWLPYLLLVAIGLLMTGLIQWSEAVYCRRYLCIGDLERTLNGLLPWLAAGVLGISWWAWRRRPRGGLAVLSLIAAGCLAVIWAVQISRYNERQPMSAVSLANALAQAARPPAHLALDWESPAILPLSTYLLLSPETMVSDYVTFRQAGQQDVRGGLALNVYDQPFIAGLVFERLVERLPAGRLIVDGQPAGEQAYHFGRGPEQHLFFLRCRAVVYLWTVGLSDGEAAAFAGQLDQWLTEVTCDR